MSGRNVSVERALRWLQQFAAREWALVLPVALAFFGLPNLVLTVLLSQRIKKVPQTMADIQAISANLPSWWWGVYAAVLLAALFGATVVMALALRPRISVAEALLVAARRMPIALLSGVMIGAGIFVLLIIALTIAMLASSGPMVLAAIAAFFALVLLATVFAILLMLPLVLVRQVGPIAAIREGWRLYAGSVLRIAGGLILFGLAAWLVLFVIQITIGSMLLMLGQTIGRREVSDVLVAVLASAVSSVGWAGLYLLVPAFYRQRTGEL